MGAAYTIADYMGLFLVYTLGSVLVVGAFCVFLIHKLAKKQKQFWLILTPLVGYIVFLYLLSLHAVPVLEQTGDLLVPSEYERKITAGEIVCVTPVEHDPVYYINGEIRGADHIVIGETTYYVISDGLLKEGMLVELQYAQFENNVILGWQEVSEDRVAMVLEEQLNAPSITKPVSPPKEVPKQIQKISHVLYILGFVGFLVCVAVSELLNHKIVNYLFAKDRAVHSQIVPNRISIVFTIIPLVCFSMIIIALSMGSGEYHGLLILIVGGGAMAAIMLVEQFTYLKINGQCILIKKLWKVKQYCAADICSVMWKSCRGMIGKRLILIFNDGKSYWFNMDHYMGVQNTYNELKKHLDESSSVVPAEE